MFLIFIVGYERTKVGSPCDEEQYEIKSEEECKLAGTSLGLTWSNAFNITNDFPACLYSDDGRNKVHYNQSPNPKRTDFNPKYSAICKKQGRKCLIVLTIHFFGLYFYALDDFFTFHNLSRIFSSQLQQPRRVQVQHQPLRRHRSSLLLQQLQQPILPPLVIYIYKYMF